MDDFMSRVQNAEDLGQVPWWHPTEATPAVVGELVEYRETDTDYGIMRGAVLRVELPAPVQDAKVERPRLAQAGEFVCVWLKGTVLKNEWAKLRPEPMVGERVGVKVVGVGESSRGKYRVYKVFVDRSPVATPIPTSSGVADPASDSPMSQEAAFADAGGSDLEDDLPF